MHIVDHENVLSLYCFFSKGELHEAGSIHALDQGKPVLGSRVFFTESGRSHLAPYRFGDQPGEEGETRGAALARFLRGVQYQFHSAPAPVLDPPAALEKRERPAGRRIRSPAPHRFHESLARPFVGEESFRTGKLSEVKTRASKTESAIGA